MSQDPVSIDRCDIRSNAIASSVNELSKDIKRYHTESVEAIHSLEIDVTKKLTELNGENQVQNSNNAHAYDRLSEIFSSFRDQIIVLSGDISSLRGDLAERKADSTKIESKVEGMEKALESIKGDIAKINTEITTMKDVDKTRTHAVKWSLWLAGKVSKLLWMVFGGAIISAGVYYFDFIKPFLVK